MKKVEVILLANGNEARYFLPPDSILSVTDGSDVHAGDVLARTPKLHLKPKILLVAYLELQNCLKRGSQKTMQLYPKYQASSHLEKILEESRK